MRYILNRQFLLRGWYKAPTGLYDLQQREARFFIKEEYLLLMRCDGAHEMDEAALGEDDRLFLQWLKEEGIIREAALWIFLRKNRDTVPSGPAIESTFNGRLPESATLNAGTASCPRPTLNTELPQRNS